MTFRSILSQHKEEKLSKKERKRLEYEERKAPEILDPSDEIFGRISPQIGQQSRSQGQSAFDLPRSRTWASDDYTGARRASGTSSNPSDWRYDAPTCLVSPNSSFTSTVSRNPSTTSSHSESLTAAQPQRPRPFSYVPGEPSGFGPIDYYSPPQQTGPSSPPQIRRKPIVPKQNLTCDTPGRADSSMDTNVCASLSTPFSMDNPFGEYIASPIQERPRLSERPWPSTSPQEDAEEDEHDESGTLRPNSYPHTKHNLASIPEDGDVPLYAIHQQRKDLTIR